VARAAASKDLEALKAKGMLVNELSPAETARMRNAAQAGVGQVRGLLRPAFMRDFYAEMDRIRKK